MRNPRILNRRMFNPNVSAYGRGIASNLVSEQERIRFNAGGRVGLKYGSEYLMKIPGVSKLVSKIPGFGKTQSYAKWLQDKVAGTTAPGFGAKDIGTLKAITGAAKKAAGWAGKKLYDRPGTIGLPVAGGTYWGLSKIFGGDDEEIAGVPTDGDWAKKLQTKPMETEQLDVEEVADWTPKEKAEKKRDMALMMAERLIGGSRDKWGSKAQMENIAGGLGDIRKITDKEALRKDERKYRAATKMYKDLAKSEFERQTSYEAAIGKGANHQQALAATTGITGTLNRSADKEKQKEDDKAIGKQGPGTVFFDEESNSWRIFTPDGKSVKVTVTEIEEAYKSGALDKMRKKKKGKKDELITETKIAEGPVTQTGNKPILDTSDPQVFATGMPFFN